MRPLLFCLAPLALAACSRPAAPPSDPEPSSATVAWITYACEDGRTVKAEYPDSRTAHVQVDGETYALKVAVSGSGARYVGDGLQWWTKGPEGMLAPLKDGEKIAAAPGVRCAPPSDKPVAPPAPGTPGGLPDDRTPLDERPAKAGSAQAAATVVETYYALVESGRAAEAAKLRADGVVEDTRGLKTMSANVGAPGAVEGAAGSLYVDVPVVVYGRWENGAEYHRSGKATLRRVNDVPGSTPEQRAWRIVKIELKP